MKLSESYNSLKLRNVKITLKTQKFQQHGSHLTFTYNFKFFKLNGSTMQTNRVCFYSSYKCHSKQKLFFDVD
jgi:hypothetical protein